MRNSRALLATARSLFVSVPGQRQGAIRKRMCPPQAPHSAAFMPSTRAQLGEAVCRRQLVILEHHCLMAKRRSGACLANARAPFGTVSGQRQRAIQKCHWPLLELHSGASWVTARAPVGSVAGQRHGLIRERILQRQRHNSKAVGGNCRSAIWERLGLAELRNAGASVATMKARFGNMSGYRQGAIREIAGHRQDDLRERS